MNTRLRQIIDYKTGGSQKTFAEMMGWSPQYLFRLLKGEGGIGIRPVIAILEKFPDINARWLLLGEGAMVSTGIDKAKAHLIRLLTLEKYMPVMSTEELNQLTIDGVTDFPAEKIEEWETMLARRQDFINAAMQRSAGAHTTRAAKQKTCK